VAALFARNLTRPHPYPKIALRSLAPWCPANTCEILAAKTWLVAQPTGEGFQVEIGLSIMRAFKVCPAILFALAVVGPAYAQDEVKRSETEFWSQTSGGAAEVCGLDYTIM